MLSIGVREYYVKNRKLEGKSFRSIREDFYKILFFSIVILGIKFL